MVLHGVPRLPRAGEMGERGNGGRGTLPVTYIKTKNRMYKCMGGTFPVCETS